MDPSYWLKTNSTQGDVEYLPRIVDVTASPIDNDEDPKQSKKTKSLLWLLLSLLSLLFLLILLAIILIPLLINRRTRGETTLSTTLSTITTTSPPINCIYPNVYHPSGICVNIMIDSNNCGSIGNVCPLNSSCSAGVCHNVPGIVLSNPISIWSSPVNGPADDRMFDVTLPWNVTLYQTSTNRIVVTTDGVVCLGSCSTVYTETRLPSNAFTDAVAFPFWDDLYIFGNTSQGIYYQSQGEAPSRNLTIEFYMSHYVEPNQFYHFQVVFFENQPGIVQYIYYQATDGGDTCTIGAQASATGPIISYSYDQANSVRPNLVLTLNSITGTFQTSTLT